MEPSINISTSLSISQLAQQLRQQLTFKDRVKLVDLLKDEKSEPSEEQILSDLKESYVALQNGSLKTRPLKDVLNEL